MIKSLGLTRVGITHYLLLIITTEGKEVRLYIEQTPELRKAIESIVAQAKKKAQ